MSETPERAILIADDNADLLARIYAHMAFSDLVLDEGVKVLRAANGTEAIDQLRDI